MKLYVANSKYRVVNGAGTDPKLIKRDGGLRFHDGSFTEYYHSSRT